MKYYSPVGVAAYPYLTRPDTAFNATKYKITVTVSGKDAIAAKKDLDALMASHKYKTKEPNKPYAEDDEGNLLIKFSSKFMPTVVDAKEKKIFDQKTKVEKLKDIRIGSGSTVRAAGEPFFYDKGLSLQLQSVQLIELVEWGDGSGFGEADGYSHEDAEEAADEDNDGDVDNSDDGEGEEDLDL